jgi:hypothetical protein
VKNLLSEIASIAAALAGPEYLGEERRKELAIRVNGLVSLNEAAEDKAYRLGLRVGLEAAAKVADGKTGSGAREIAASIRAVVL